MRFFSISEGAIGFPFFGGFHLAWLIGLVLFGLLAYKPFKQEKRFFIILPLIPLGLKIVRVSVLLLTDQFYSYDEIPLHLCNLSIVVCAVYALTRWKGLENYIYFLSLPAAFVTLFFPGWGNLPTWSYYTFESFISHGILVIYPLYLLKMKKLIPNPKGLPKLFLVLLVSALPIHLINLYLDTNFCYIEHPLEGTPLVLFDGLFGLPYQFGLVLVLLAVWTVCYALYFTNERLVVGRLRQRFSETR